MNWLNTAISTLLSAGLMAWLIRATRRAPEMLEDGVVSVRYPREMRWFQVFGTVFCAVVVGLAVWLLLAPDKPRDRMIGAVALPIIGALGFVTWREFQVFLVADREGIRGTTAFRGHRSMRWDDLTEVRLSPIPQWLVLRDRYGETIRVSLYMSGWAAVLRILAESVDPAVWRDAVRRAPSHERDLGGADGRGP